MSGESSTFSVAPSMTEELISIQAAEIMRLRAAIDEAKETNMQLLERRQQANTNEVLRMSQELRPLINWLRGMVSIVDKPQGDPTPNPIIFDDGLIKAQTEVDASMSSDSEHWCMTLRELELIKAERDDLRVQMALWREREQTLINRLSEEQSKNEVLSKKVADEQMKVTEMCNELAQARKQAASALQALSETEEEASDLRNKVNELKLELSKLQECAAIETNASILELQGVNPDREVESTGIRDPQLLAQISELEGVRASPEPTHDGSTTMITSTGEGHSANSHFGDDDAHSRSSNARPNLLEGVQILSDHPGPSLRKKSIKDVQNHSLLLHLDIRKIQIDTVVWTDCPNAGFLLRTNREINKEGVWKKSEYKCIDVREMAAKSHVEFAVGRSSNWYYIGTYRVGRLKTISAEDYRALPARTQQTICKKSGPKAMYATIEQAYLEGTVNARKCSIERVGFSEELNQQWRSLTM